jgi:hypothetical protein
MSETLAIQPIQDDRHDLAPEILTAEARLTAIARQQIRQRKKLLQSVIALQRGHCAALKRLSAQTGISWQTLYRWFHAARDGRDADLADKRRDSRSGRAANATATRCCCPAADIQRYRNTRGAPARRWKQGGLAQDGPRLGGGLHHHHATARPSAPAPRGLELHQSAAPRA